MPPLRTLVGSALVVPVVFLFSEVAFCQENRLFNNEANKHQLQEYIQEFFLFDAVRCQEKGEWQFTAGVDSRRVGTSAVLKTEFGVTNRLQLNAELPYGFTEEEVVETHSRWTTASLGMEYQIIKAHLFALSAGITFGIPVRSGGEVEYEPALRISTSFHKFQIHASFVADVEEENPSFQYDLGSVYKVRRHWFPTFEFNGRNLNSTHAYYLTPGLYRRLKHRFELGAGIPVGIGGNAGNAGVIGKLTWEFGGGHDRP